MISPTHTVHLSLLRKYGGRIMQATHNELVFAGAQVPKGKNALKHLFEALRLHRSQK